MVDKTTGCKFPLALDADGSKPGRARHAHSDPRDQIACSLNTTGGWLLKLTDGLAAGRPLFPLRSDFLLTDLLTAASPEPRGWLAGTRELRVEFVRSIGRACGELQRFQVPAPVRISRSATRHRREGTSTGPSRVDAGARPASRFLLHTLAPHKRAVFRLFRICHPGTPPSRPEASRQAGVRQENDLRTRQRQFRSGLVLSWSGQCDQVVAGVQQQAAECRLCKVAGVTQ